jgi:hypothetical protein
VTEVGAQLSPEDSPAASGRRGRLVRRSWLRKALVGALALLTAGFLYSLAAWYPAHELADQENGAAEVVRGFSLALTNFEPSTIDSDFTRLLGYATGQFLAQARATFASQTVRSLVETDEVASRGQVASLFVRLPAHLGHMSFYVEIDTTSVSKEVTKAQFDTIDLLVSLVQTDGAWRVSAVQTVRPGGPLGLSAGG